MSITELLEHVGLEHVKVQPLFGSVTQATRLKAGCKVTFVTDAISPADVLLSSDRESPGTIGLVLWLPKDRLPEDAKEALTQGGH